MLTDFLDEYIRPFQRVKYYYDPDVGYIVWRLGTGKNIELLHIRTFVKGKRLGKVLFYQMLDTLKDAPPYYSIYGFTRDSNEIAQKFYGALGFNLHFTAGPYKDNSGMLFWQSFDVLLAKREESYK